MPRPLPPDILESTGGEAGAVRDHILDATLLVIDTEGLAAASTRTIAGAAGLGAGTLYNYFDDRRQLLAQAILRRAETLAGPLHDLATLAGTRSLAENLRHVARLADAVLDELVPLLGAAFSDGELLDALRRELASESSIDPVVPVERYLLAERNLGRVAPNADCRAAAATLISLFHDSAFQRHLRGDTGPRRVPGREIDLIVVALTAP